MADGIKADGIKACFKALIFGANGQLGQELQMACPPEVELVTVTRDQCDFLTVKEKGLQGLLERYLPDVVINAAAYTAVDDAEDHEEEARQINAIVPAQLANLCSRGNIRFIHVSTDFVFDGTATQPYPVTASTSPKSVYGKTKAEGEAAVIKNCPQAIIVRTSWLYTSHGKNFVNTMLRIMAERDEMGVVGDQIGAPTSASGLARIIWKLAALEDASGIYHWSDRGECSWYDFAKAINEIAVERGMLGKVTVNRLSTEDWPAKAVRPKYSVMDISATEQLLGESAQPWQKSLEQVIDEKLRG